MDDERDKARRAIWVIYILMALGMAVPLVVLFFVF